MEKETIKNKVFEIIKSKLSHKDTPLIMESKLIDMMHPAIDGLGTLYLCAGLNTG